MSPIVAHLLVFAATGLLAEPAHEVVEWTAPASCPSEAEVGARVEQYLGRPATAEDARHVVATAAVEPSPGGFAMRMSLESPSGTSTKELEAQQCDVLMDAFALELALAIDPMQALDQLARSQESNEEPAPSDASPEPVEKVVAPKPVAARPREPAPRAEPAPALGDEPRLRAALGVDGGILVGPLPDVTGGIGISIGLLGRAWRVEVAGQVWLGGKTRHAVQKDVGGDLSLGLVSLRGCPVPRLGPVELPVCGGIEAGAMRGDPVGVREPRVRHRAWLAFTGGFAVVWPAHRRVALRLVGDAVIPVLRPGFRIEGLGTLHVADPIGARATGGVEVRF